MIKYFYITFFYNYLLTNYVLFGHVLSPLKRSYYMVMFSYEVMKAMNSLWMDKGLKHYWAKSRDFGQAHCTSGWCTHCMIHYQIKLITENTCLVGGNPLVHLYIIDFLFCQFFRFNYLKKWVMKMEILNDNNVSINMHTCCLSTPFSHTW